MKFLQSWLFTLLGSFTAGVVLFVDKVGTFFLFVPVDRFYVDVLIAVLILATGVLIDNNLRRLRKEIEIEKQLVESMAQVRVLRGLLPICASCKKVRDDKGYWQQIESYIRDHSEADFSHSICPDCMKRLYGPEGLA
jgi:hypothetical protein